jgi:NifU-like protein involved in Fe-S cluster formation
VYSPVVREHATNPRNRQPLAQANGQGESRFPICGDEFKLFLQIQEDRIQAATFEAKACGPVIAMGSLGTELLVGKGVEEARQLSAFALDKQLGGLPPAKRHAILMFLDALQQALPSQA